MTEQEIKTILNKQREYFTLGATLPASFRLEQLGKLKTSLQRHEADLDLALQQDLGKSRMESYMCEIGLTLSELTWVQKHLKGLMKEKRVPTPLSQFAARSFRSPSPYGTVLIMSPWNYPVLLTLDPLIDAIAAGNTAVVKPSAYAPATAAVLQKIIEECFPAEYVAVVTGGRAENQALLQQKFDRIFFTGGKTVGREVLRHAAEYLTPVTLELGGKSPCIVDATANIPLAARRIVFGKYLNCGQTCVAPDYILCDRHIHDQLVEAIRSEINRQFGEDPLQNPDYGKIINEKHFHRLLGLIDPDKTVCGGQYDEQTLRIAPTVMTNVTWEDAVMGEEIFGPILTVLTYDGTTNNTETICNHVEAAMNTEIISTGLQSQMSDQVGKVSISQTRELCAPQDFISWVIRCVEEHPHPLALYLFSEDKKARRRILDHCHFGGGCINDTIIHLATSAMPFGGVGESGMGGYHGKTGFETFSHYRSIVDKKTWMDLPIRYQKYSERKEKLLRMFLK